MRNWEQRKARRLAELVFRLRLCIFSVRGDWSGPLGSILSVRGRALPSNSSGLNAFASASPGCNLMVSSWSLGGSASDPSLGSPHLWVLSSLKVAVSASLITSAFQIEEEGRENSSEKPWVIFLRVFY